MLGEILTKLGLRSKKKFGPKNIWFQNNFGQQNFGLKRILVQKIFGSEKNVGPKIYIESKKAYGPHTMLGL